MRHHDVASTLVQHCFKVVCPLREREREGERERGGGASSCWKNDTFVTHSWGSLKYDKGLI